MLWIRSSSCYLLFWSQWTQSFARISKGWDICTKEGDRFKILWGFFVNRGVEDSMYFGCFPNGFYDVSRGREGFCLGKWNNYLFEDR